MLVFAPCSSTKLVPTPRALVAARIPRQSVAGFAREWVRRVEAAGALHKPAEVYGGPSVHAARRAAEYLGAPLHFVSAGMSVVGPRARIPGYDLTMSMASGGTQAAALEGTAPADWWAALNLAFGRTEPIASMVRRHDDLALVALPDAYLAMVEDELLALTPHQRKKLRLIVASQRALPTEFEQQAIRYDRRLQALNGAPGGTMASIAQRALQHFAEVLSENPRVRSVTSQRALVDAALSKVRAPSPVVRKVRSDAQIASWIRRKDPNGTRSRSVLLAQLRNDGFACEYTRFFKLVDAQRKSK
jgi:hypothetical protein